MTRVHRLAHGMRLGRRYVQISTQTLLFERTRSNHLQEASMRRCVAAIACAVFLGVASLAQAAQLLSPPYAIKTRGNNVGTKAACVIRNAGTTPVTVTVSLLANNDTVGIFDFCKDNGQPRTLAGGESCLVSADLLEGGNGLTAGLTATPGGGSYVACRVTAPTVANLRGTLELADSPSHGFDVYLAIDF
ncbi:MAG: hypothetical protein C5B48_10535 [Candidatus Rokuibacteriota bacterium]|nr:MAG: hypothetical protein C5B48_10535 [Candidatus Rokubacteria bacterium]